jgi:hypothetical protein
MRTLSVQQMPNGYELEVPTFWYWFKAGVAFTMGAGIVTFCGVVAWAMLSWGAIAAFSRTLVR